MPDSTCPTMSLPAIPEIDDEGLTRRIERMILRGELPAGSKLREVALTQQLGVGRGPLREAIRILEGRRLLVRSTNAGVSVIALSIDDFDQILVTREALEGMAARLAAENMNSAEIQALHGMVESLEKADIGDREPIGIFDKGPDNDFHRNIALGSRNKWIAQLLCDDLYPLLRLLRFRAAELRTDPLTSHIDHRGIIDRIQHRDGDGAEELMRAHVRKSRTRLLTHLRQTLP